MTGMGRMVAVMHRPTGMEGVWMLSCTSPEAVPLGGGAVLPPSWGGMTAVLHCPVGR